MVKFKFDIINKLFTMKVVKYWNKLPSEVISATSLELLEVSLYGALSNQTVQDVPVFFGSLHQMAFQGPLQPKQCLWDSMILVSDVYHNSKSYKNW